MIKIHKTKCQRPTGSLAQAGVLSRVTPRRILEVYLPSKPYRYPRLPQAAKTLAASVGRQCGEKAVELHLQQQDEIGKTCEAVRTGEKNNRKNE